MLSFSSEDGKQNRLDISPDQALHKYVSLWMHYGGLGQCLGLGKIFSEPLYKEANIWELSKSLK